MIRINLLEETRVAAKARGPGFSLPKLEVAENVPVIMLAVGMGVAVLGVFVGWLYYAERIDALKDQITKAEAERNRLEYVLKQSEELNQKKADLARKISIIAELKEKQTVPVMMLDQLSKNLPDHVWFEELNFTGETISLRGTAQTPFSYSNLLRNLEESPYFRDVATGKVVNDKGLTKFNLTMTFRPVPPAGSAATPAVTSGTPDPAAPAAGSRRRR